MADKRKKILIVDDDSRNIFSLTSTLENMDADVYSAFNGKEALEVLENDKKIDLILMDIMMPEMDGMTAVKKIKALPDTEDIMIVFLTARADDFSQEAGFEAGADDYIAKPIKPKILVHRINALLRRVHKPDSLHKTIVRGNLMINPTNYIVIYQSNEIVLPRKEFELLQLLASYPNKVFNRDEILAKVWGKDVVVGDRTIDVHIRKIREKINADIIITIKGVGYKFVEQN